MDLGQSLAFSTEDKVTANVSVETQEVVVNDKDFDWYFEIVATAGWIKDNKFQKAALQFPDSLLKYATKISLHLESLINFKPHILADTSYGSCCVDEVAAEHVNADCLIHYGDACKTKLEGRIPVKYVLPKVKLDTDNFKKALNAWKTSEDFRTLVVDKQRSLTFIFDLNYSHLKESLTDILHAIFGENVQIYFDIDFNTHFSDNCVLIFIGCSNGSIKLTLLMMVNPTSAFLTFNETTMCIQRENLNVNKLLKKRLYLIEKARDANIVGIVIGTLSLANYLSVLNRLKVLCKNTKKTYYVLSVGKLNVPKLSNFAEVDVFVLLSCPYNLIFDSSDYYRPILSPFEFEIACNPSKNWMAGSGWTPENTSILKDEADNTNQVMPETDLSLVTGKLRNLNYSENVFENDSSLMKRSDVLQLQVASSETHFQNRFWKGLEDNVGQTPVAKIKEGRSGIAAEYENEPKDVLEK